MINELRKLADQVDDLGLHTLADRLDALLVEAADPSELVQRNLQRLQKDRPRSPEEDPRAYYEALQHQALEGPIYPQGVIQAIQNIPDHLMPNQPKLYVKFLAQQFLQGVSLPNNNTLQSLKDYINNNGLTANSLLELIQQSERWHKEVSQQRSPVQVKQDQAGQDQVEMTFPDGFSIVQVAASNLAQEGSLMGHCVGSYCHEVESGLTRIYSLRDSKNQPHVTLEVSLQKSTPTLIQVQGKQNTTPVAKYIPYLSQWLNQTGLQTTPEIRASLMDADSALDFVESLRDSEDLALMHNGKEWNLLTNLAELTPHPEVIDALLMSPYAKIHEGFARDLASNSNLSLQQSKNLLEKHSKKTSLAEAFATYTKHPALLTAIAKQFNLRDDVMSNLLANPRTPEKILKQQLNNKRLTRDIAIAANPNVPAEMLTEMTDRLLTHYPIPAINWQGLLYNVTDNVRLPVEDLRRIVDFIQEKKLDNTYTHDVALGAIDNPEIDEALLIELVEMAPTRYVVEKSIDHPNSTPKSLQFAWESVNHYDRLTYVEEILEAFLANPQTPADVLEGIHKDLLSDNYWDASTITAFLVALENHPNLPKQLKEDLSNEVKHYKAIHV